MKSLKYLFLIVSLFTSASVFSQEEVPKKEVQDSIPTCSNNSCSLEGSESQEADLSDGEFAQAFLNPNVMGFPLNGHISQSRFICEEKLNGAFLKESYKKNSYLCHSHKNRMSVSFTTDDNHNVVVIRAVFYDTDGYNSFLKELKRYHKKWSKLGVEKGEDTLFDTSRWSTQFLYPKGNRKKYVIYCYNVVFASKL